MKSAIQKLKNNSFISTSKPIPIIANFGEDRVKSLEAGKSKFHRKNSEFRGFIPNNKNSLRVTEKQSKIGTNLVHINEDLLSSAGNTINREGLNAINKIISPMITTNDLKAQAISSFSVLPIPTGTALDYLIDKFDAVIAGDTEFQNNLLLPSNYTNFDELKKILCNREFVLTQLATLNSKVTTYEHPSVGANLLPTWNGNSVIPYYLGFNEVERPKGTKPALFKIAYLFYFSAYDIFGLFRDTETQIKIARELLGGRLMREKSFPNAIKTGVFIEVPSINKKGQEILEIKEIAIKLYDAKGYTPAGVSGLEKTFETWGVKFENKAWKDYFDITRFKDEYLNTVEMVKVYFKNGKPVSLKEDKTILNDCEVKWMSKHEITVSYATGDGIREMFELYDNVHKNIQNTVIKLGYPDFNVKNLQTIGSASNQVGIAVCLNSMDLGFNEMSQSKLAEYLYPSSAYSLLNGNVGTINLILNLDGGYCKNMKPCHPVIKDLVLDNDLAGAYAKAMESLPYCIGIPAIMSFPKDRDERPNFHKEFTKLERKGIIHPGAWVARVSTTEPLSFKQDLIFSKHFGESDYEKALVEDEDGFFELDECVIQDLTQKIELLQIPDGAFQLNNNEITNGILTHDLLQFINTYWSKSERKELFSKLQIESMMLYNKNYLMPIEHFKEEFEKLDNRIVYNFDNGVTKREDKRKLIWCIIPTDKGWFGDLTAIRNQLKQYASIAKDLASDGLLSDEKINELSGKIENLLNLPNLTDDDIKNLGFMSETIVNKKEGSAINITKLNEIVSIYKCEQNGFKCVINSTYGVTGSGLWMTEKPSYGDNGQLKKGRPKIGNIVFAQNVTARVRLGAYCMAKASNGYTVITDGTPACINEFWYWEWKGTKGETFGSQELWNLSRYNKPYEVDPKGRFNVKLAPLGNGGRWEVIELNERSKTVTISNGEKTITGTEEKWGELDKLSYQHAKSLFGELDIFKKDILVYSSKDLYTGAAFQSQANYLFEKFFYTEKDATGRLSKYKIKARGYNLSKGVHGSPDLNDSQYSHPYIDMLTGIYQSDWADIHIPSVYSPELLGVDKFNESEKIATEYANRGFLPHAPYYRSSKPSPFSMSMFKWNTREQFMMWNKKVERWKNKTGYGIELLFITEEIVNGKEKISYSYIVNKIQEMIDDNTTSHSLDKQVSKKLDSIRHPQKYIEDNLACELNEN